MGEEQNPLSGKVGLDTTEFKAGITALNRDIRVIESGFRATAAGLGDWSKSSQGVEMRMKALTSEIEVQQKKVEATRTAYEQLAAANGAGSRAAEDMQIKLNKESETLGKMQNELNQSKTQLGELKDSTGQAAGGMDHLDTETEKTGKQMNTLKEHSGNLGKVLKDVGIGLAAVATAAAGAVAGIGAFVLKTARTADDLDELSQKTGISTTRLQELGYIGKQSGIDMEMMTGSLSKMIRNMGAAEKAGSPAAQAFKELGVHVMDSNGHMRDSETVYGEALTALGKITNETERDIVAQQIFGKSAMELNPLILLGADGMSQMTQQAHEMGAVMSTENVKSAADLNDKLDGLKSGLQGTAMTLITTLMPGLSGAGSMLMGFGEKLARIVDISQANPKGAQDLLNGLIGDIAAQIPKLLGAGLKIIQGLLTGIVAALPALLPAVVGIMTSLVTFLVQAVPMLVDAASQIILALVTAIFPMLPQLLTAAIQIIVTLANGISQALPAMIPAIVQVITQLVLILVQNLPLLIQAGMTLLNAVIQGIIAAIPILVQQWPIILNAFGAALAASWPILQQLGMQLLGQLVVGISQALPGLITGSQQILDTITTALNNGLKSLLAIGKAIVDGIWQGIQANAAKFYSNVLSFFTGIVQAVNNALHIHSPSKVFATIGSNMALGVGVGFAQQIQNVQKGIVEAMGGIGGMNMGVAGAGGGLAYSTQTVYNFGPVYYGASGSNNGSSTDPNQALRY